MPEGKHKPRSGPALSFRAAPVQRLRRLLRDPGRRRQEGAFVIEGPTLLAEARRAGASLEAVYVEAGTDDPTVRAAEDDGVVVHELAPGVIERVADTVTPRPVLAIAKALDVPIEKLSDASLVVVSAGIADPGNLGTVLRAAEAAGADGVLCCAGSVDVYNPKTVRASAGSLFHVPVVVGGDPGEVLSQLGAWGLRRLATRPRGDHPYDRTDLTGRVAVVLGSEAHGLDAALAGAVDEVVAIPMAGRAESLNVAMAAAVMVFEAARQRRAAAKG